MLREALGGIEGHDTLGGEVGFIEEVGGLGSCQGSEQQGREDEAAKGSDVEERDGAFHDLAREFWAVELGLVPISCCF